MKNPLSLFTVAVVGSLVMSGTAMAQNVDDGEIAAEAPAIQVSADDGAAAAAAATVVVDAAANEAEPASDAPIVVETAPQPVSDSGNSTYDVYVVPADSANVPPSNLPPEEVAPARTRDNLLGTGGMIAVNIGPNYSFKDRLYTSGDRSFEVPTAGLEASVDLGFKYKYVGVFLEVMFRGGAAMDDDVHYHCPTNSFSMSDTCFKYYAIEKGDWDTYFMGVGAMLNGYIPITSWVFGTIGVGFIGYIGRTTDGDESAYNYAFKVTAGVNFAVTPDIALGFAINYEGLEDRRQSIQPAFSLVYNY